MTEFDAGDPTHVKKRKTKDDLENERRVDEVRQLLQHKGNRYFLWRLLEYCGLWRTLSTYDPHYMAVNSGLRDVGLFVWFEIEKADPKAFQKMRQEAEEREETK